MNGFLIFDKPAGITSHDVVAKVRRTLNQKKVGHTGTLDPFATGVLPIALGDATKIIPYLDESVKEYRARMQLGISTDTQDCTGKVIQQIAADNVTEALVLKTFAEFTGSISQVPPMFSAVKQGGVPLYKKARLGEEVERSPRLITIHSLTVNHFQLPFVTFTVQCSRGTYVRTLANDLGNFLGCGAHLVELRRTKSGIFTEDMSIQLELLQKSFIEGHLTDYLLSPLQVLSHLAIIRVTEEGAKKIAVGRAPSITDYERHPEEGIIEGQSLCLVRNNKLLAIGSCNHSSSPDEEKTIRLLRVFT